MNEEIVKYYPNSLAEARDKEEKYFFTGKPCKNGHYSLKRASGRSCIECARERVARYRARNREELNARMQKYREENKEYVNELARKAYAKNSNHHKERKQKWREDNPEKLKEIQARFRDNNREKLKEKRKKRR